MTLVGMMGAGKSAVGRVCSERLRRPFVDTDAVIEQDHGRTVAEIFQGDGEAAFRLLEARAVASVVRSSIPLVIACGGGAVIDPRTRSLLKDTGFVVWLTADPAELASRVGGSPARPLLVGRDAPAVLSDLAEARQEAYRDVADAVVSTNGRDVLEVAEVVLEAAGPALSGESA